MKEMKIILIVLVVGIISGAAGSYVSDKFLTDENKELAYDHLVSKPLAETSSYQLLRLLNDTNTVIVDVRNQDAYALGHIKGAISMPFAGEQTNYNELPKDKNLVVYCWSKECMLGPTTSAFLATKGILTKELRIGWCEWSERGYPIDGKRYIIKDECLEPQRSINDEKVIVLNSLEDIPKKK